MLPKTCVVVPTYWTRAGGVSRPGDAVYDHPTALDGPDTLTALLESLQRLDTDAFYLLVLVAVTGEDVAISAEGRVRELVGRQAGMTSLVFGASHLRWLHAWLRERVSPETAEYLQLREYPRIRNLQLAIPYALGSEAIVALDDDEIVTDPEFLTKAIEPLGTEQDGKRIDGLSGHYLQEDGTILLRIDEQKAKSSNLFDRKAAVMNAATEMLEREPGNLVETPFCFGGNMEFSQELAASVGFDPGITRGEDIDYLINARMEGKCFFLRKDLRILHCPPTGGSYRDTSLSKLEQDVIRFLYEKAKLGASERISDLAPVTAEELKPYPGDFLIGDVREDAREALTAAGYPGDADTFLDRVEAENDAKIERYLRFRREWPGLQHVLRDSDQVRDRLMADVTEG